MATNRRDPDADPPLPAADDPGGAHTKGYSADPDPVSGDVPDPVPLADAPPGATIIQPERAGRASPTGRGKPGG